MNTLVQKTLTRIFRESYKTEYCINHPNKNAIVKVQDLNFKNWLWLCGDCWEKSEKQRRSTGYYEQLKKRRKQKQQIWNIIQVGLMLFMIYAIWKSGLFHLYYEKFFGG